MKILGKGRARKWIKLHVAIDANTQEIVGRVSTESSEGDGAVFPSLFGQIQHRVHTVIGDGTYDGQEIRETIRKRRGRVLIPSPRHPVCRGDDPDHDRAFSRTSERQAVENRLKCVLLNKKIRAMA